MSALVPYAVWAIIGIICLGILAILVFGVRAMVQGKARPLTVGLMAVPFVLFLLFGLIMSSWAMAAMWTVIIMFALGVISLLSAGVWGIFT